MNSGTVGRISCAAFADAEDAFAVTFCDGEFSALVAQGVVVFIQLLLLRFKRGPLLFQRGYFRERLIFAVA